MHTDTLPRRAAVRCRARDLVRAASVVAYVLRLPGAPADSVDVVLPHGARAPQGGT